MTIDSEALAAARSIEEILAATGGGAWVVEAHAVGNRIHVEPMNGLLTDPNWALSAGAHWWVTAWRWLTFGGHRSMFPRTERQLAHAIADCERWCSREMAKEAAGKRLLSKGGLAER